MKYLSWKDLKPCVADLKKVYKANNAEMALVYLGQAEEKWNSKYAVIFKSWRTNWDRIATFFQYPPALRKIITPPIPLRVIIEWFAKSLKQKVLSALKMLSLNKSTWPL